MYTLGTLQKQFEDFTEHWWSEQAMRIKGYLRTYQSQQIERKRTRKKRCELLSVYF
jgi:hypothetical protein